MSETELFPSACASLKNVAGSCEECEPQRYATLANTSLIRTFIAELNRSRMEENAS